MPYWRFRNGFEIVDGGALIQKKQGVGEDSL